MTLHDLFIAVDAERRLDNPFVTTEGERLYKALCDEIKKPEEGTPELLDETIIHERENAFKVGFKTTIELLFSCYQW